MKQRIFKNYVTTIVGLLILIVAIVIWTMDAKPTDEVMLIAGYGILFLRSKDSLIGLPEKENAGG